MMKKALFATAIALFMGIGANAQLKVGGGFMAGLPMGEFSDLAGFGIGGGISAEYMLTDNIGIGVNVGYLSFSGLTQEIDFMGSTVEFEVPRTTMIPIQIQGNYHFMPREDFNLYAGLGLGRNIISFEGEDSSPSDGEFTITPRIGVNFMFNDAFGLDFNTGYTIAGDFYSYIPLNLGVIYFVD